MLHLRKKENKQLKKKKIISNLRKETEGKKEGKREANKEE